MIDDSPPVIQMRSISKRYPGVKALEQVDWEVRRGEVHALVGKNGAGKSTLIKILGGAVQPDTGEIRLNGRKVHISSPRSAIAQGIAIINQELMLIPQLNVAENILLGRLPHNRFGQVNWKKAFALARGVLDRIGLDIDPSAVVGELSVAQQQTVEICRALSRQADILVMDEPTSALASREVEKLLATVHRLREQGTTIIYITHKLGEVFAVADRITVMRDGQKIGTANTDEVTPTQVVNMMVGRRLEVLFHKESAEVREPVLEVKHLSRHGKFENITFSLHAGEILGLAGLVGAGRTEILLAIFGADSYDSGEIWVGGKRINHPSPEKLIEAGMGFAPEDRKQQGLVLGMNIMDNMNLASLRWMLRRRRQEQTAASRLFAGLSVQAPSLSTLVSTLSGGNQQKVVIAKWLATSPRVLFLDEPTRGIDIGAKADIHQLVQGLAQEGVGIVLVSSELQDLISVCDRILVLQGGRMVGEYRYGEANEEAIVARAVGGGELAGSDPADPYRLME